MKKSQALSHSGFYIVGSIPASNIDLIKYALDMGVSFPHVHFNCENEDRPSNRLMYAVWKNMEKARCGEITYHGQSKMPSGKRTKSY